MVLIGFMSILTAMTIGHGNLFVAIFGARIYVLQIPLIFAIGNIFDHEDVIKMGRGLLWISLPMTLLIAVQFFSPQSAWVNLGIGGDTSGGGFGGANGYFRPPGTFSFTTGVVSFYALLASYVFYFWLHPEKVNKLLLIAATGCLMISIPLSISRSALFQVAIAILFSIIAAWKRPKYVWSMIGGAIIVLVLLQIVENKSFFTTSTAAFTARFNGANESEGGLSGVFLDRFLGGMISAIQNAPNLPFFGYGIGMGTNVGSNLLTGQSAFLISEQEWGRIIGEEGLLFGFIIIIIRVSITITIAKKAIRNLRRVDALSWMLLSFCSIPLLQAQWGQPTALGFTVLGAGLAVAALNTSEYEMGEEAEEPGEVEEEQLMVDSNSQ